MRPTSMLAVKSWSDIAALTIPTRATHTDRRSKWLLALVMGMLALLSLAHIGMPVTRDEGAYLTIGREVLHGRIPFRDVFDHKGPALYYVAAAILAATRGLPPVGQVVAARFAAEAALLLSALAIYLLGMRWWSRITGAIAACLWLLAAPMYSGNAFQPDALAVAPILQAMVMVSGRPNRWRFFIAGALLALATLLKPTAALALPGLLVLGAFTARPSIERPEALRPGRSELAAATLGFVAPWLLTCAAFALAKGLGAMLRDIVIANMSAYPPDPAKQVHASILAALALCPLVWVPTATAVALGITSILLPGRFRVFGDGPHVMGLALLVVCGCLPLAAHAFLHYWLQVLPSSCLLAAWLIGNTTLSGREQPRTPGRHIARRGRQLWLVALALCGLVSAVASLVVAGIALDARGQLAEQAVFAARVAAIDPPGGRTLVGPAEPEYYFLANREPATAYIYLLPVDMTRERVDQAANDITLGHFDVIVWGFHWDAAVGREVPSSGPNIPSPSTRRLEAAIQQHYRVLYADSGVGMAIYIPR